MKVAKEIFIMALLLMIVVLMIGLVFYEYMPNNKIIPEVTSYSADSSTTSVLQEISATSTSSDDDSSSGVEDILLQSYSIGQQELSAAASKNSYTSGKTNPFAEYVEPTVNMIGNTIVNGTRTENTTTTPQKAVSGSNSTGSFFEKPNSK